MKKALLFIFFYVTAFFAAIGQQNTFDFFRWNDVPHPLYKQTYGLEPNNSNTIDSKKVEWTSSYEAKGGLITLKGGSEILSVNISPKEKTNFIYNYSTLSIDEAGNKIITARGSLRNAADAYVIIHSPAGMTKYIHPLDVKDSVNFLNWHNAYQVNSHLLIVAVDKFIWNPGIMPHLTNAELGMGQSNYNTKVFRDYNNIIHIVNNIGTGYAVVSFFPDGSYLKRLSGKVIKNYLYDGQKKSLTLITSEGFMELDGKTEVNDYRPEFEKVIFGNEVTQFEIKKYNYSVSGLISSKGFIFKSNNTYSTYAFADHQEVGKNTLSFNTYYIIKNFNLQEDSTLAIAMSYYVDNQEGKIFLFSFKNNVTTLRKTFDIMKLKLRETFNIAFYIDKSDCYLYTHEWNPMRIAQVTKDTVVTNFPTEQSPCNLYVKSSDMRADKDYLWISNENEREDTSKCRIARLRHDSKISKGFVFYDYNSNGLKDGAELGYADVKLQVLPSGLMITPDAKGDFSFTGIPGDSYSLKVFDSTRFASIKINNTNLQAGVKLNVENPVISTNLTFNRARCNTKFDAPLVVKNTGVVAADKIEISLIPNDKLQLLQGGQYVDTAKFFIAGLNAQKDSTLSYTIEWPVAEEVGKTAQVVSLTKVFKNNVLVASTKDSLETIIRCSYDPNDKNVTPVGIEKEHFTLKSTTLSYIVRFENTGNDTAYHVAIHDTLSRNLDWSTLQVTGSSHLLNTVVNKEGIAKFYFNNIMLPDTGTNKIKAQGFVSYKIQTKSGLSENARICNSAAIIFDGNKPVITNTVCNTMVERLPVVTSLNILAENENLYFTPNPANTAITIQSSIEYIEIYDQLGKLRIRSYEKKIGIADLGDGVYTVRLLNNQGILKVSKLVVAK